MKKSLMLGVGFAALFVVLIFSGLRVPDRTRAAERVFAPVAAPPASGGPDAFGYVYSGTAYSWLDIAGSGTVITFANPDEGQAQVTLPQTMTFYGNNYTSLYVATNGYAAFQSTAVITQCAPANRQPANTLAAFCSDLKIGGAVYYSTSTAYNGHTAFIVQYDTVTHTASGLTATFQIILDLQDQSIVYQYLAVPAATVPTTTVATTTIGLSGYATNAADYLTYCQSSADCPPQNGLAVRFWLPSRPVFAAKVMPSNDFPTSGQSVTYTLVLSNTGGAAANGAVMTNALPTGLEYTSGTLQATSGAVTYVTAQRAIRWDGDLAASDAVTVTYAAVFSSSNPIYNTAVVSHPLALRAGGASSSPADRWSAAALIDSAASFNDTAGSARHIALDSQSRPHIAFAGATGLYHAVLSGTTWLTETVPMTLTSPTAAALVLDDQDRAQIAFVAGSRVWVARQISVTGSLTWTIEPASQSLGTTFNARPELQRGSDGALHLLYDMQTELYYTAYSGTVWLSPTLVITSGACTIQSWAGYSLALDPGNVPHVACMKNSGSSYYEVRFYTATVQSPWTSYEVITSTGFNMNYYPSLAFDGSTPHLTFFRGTPLYHAQRSGTWTLTPVDNQNGQGKAGDVLSINGGQAHIAYALYQNTASVYTPTVRLASRWLTGTVWTTQTIQSPYRASSPGGKPTLAVDGSGRAHAAYYHVTETTLRYAAPAGSTNQIVAESRTIGNSALAIGSDGGLHLVYLSKGLRYATSISGTTWANTLAVPGVDDSWQTVADVALGGSNTPHAAYATVGGPLYHALLSGTTWITRQVDAPGNVSAAPAIGAELAGTAHIAYQALQGANLALRYAAFDGSTWVTETLAVIGPNQSDHSQLPQLIAQGGNVYVLYADCTAYQSTSDYAIRLKLATLNGAVWSTQTLYDMVGRCDWRLTYQLMGGDQGELAAKFSLSSNSARPNPLNVTLWITGGPLGPLAVKTPHQINAVTGGGSSGSYAIRYGGEEKITIGGGNKYAQYTDNNGYSSQSTIVATGLNSSAYVSGLSRRSGYAALTENVYSQNALYIEIIEPPGKPSPTYANATKRATPSGAPGVYATQPIAYKIDLEWTGDEIALISVNDPIAWPNLLFVQGSLSWGPHIAQCLYAEPPAPAIGCGGQFPPTVAPLQTQVTFGVTATCSIYDLPGQNIYNTAAVNIGSHHFDPTATTLERTPFRLRANTPSFLPTAVFTPEQTVLLYTVPKGDEPDALWQQCGLDAYVVVNDDVAHPIKMTNDGQGLPFRTSADFNAGDVHHSTWFTPTNELAQKLELYIVSAGKGFDNSVLADTLLLPPNTQPQLVVLTDYSELFREFDATSPGSPVADTNGDKILDYYEAVERMRQYADAHNGVVLDVRQDAYTDDWGFSLGFDARQTMGEEIDQLIAVLNRFELVGLWNLAIIGDDAVVPFYRMPVPASAFDETGYPNSLATGADGNPTLLDVGNKAGGAVNGYQMSDVPYGTWEVGLGDYPKPTMSVGRIFYAKPLELIAAIDAYEQPINLRKASSQSAALYLADETGTGIRWAQLFAQSLQPVLEAHYGAGVKRNVPRDGPAVFEDGNAYLYNGMTTAWNAPTTTVRAAGNADVLIIQSHASHLSITTQERVLDNAKPNITALTLSAATSDLALSSGCHSGFSTAYTQNAAAHAYYRQGLARTLLDSHTAYFAPMTFGTTISNVVSYHDRLLTAFLEAAFSPYRSNIGEAYYAAFSRYTPTGADAADRGFDQYVLYSMELYGLPTQPLSNRAAALAAARATQLSLRPATSDVRVASLAPVTATEVVTITHFAVSFDGGGRALFDIPQQGGRFGEAFGPVLPAVYRAYPLPWEAQNIQVTLVQTQTHAYPAPVDLQTAQPIGYSFGPLTGTFTYTLPYPDSVLQTQLVTDHLGLRLAVIARPLQYNTATRQVTLYDGLSYRITYNAPNTVTLQSLIVNGGNPVAAGSGNISVSVMLNSAVPLSGTLVWAVEDGTGLTVVDDATSLNLPIGATALSWNIDTSNWKPGAKHAWIAVRDESSKVIASGWTDFNATGKTLSVEAGRGAYTELDSTAEIRATVRDETGAGTSGQSGNLALRLNGNLIGGAWQSGADGLYTTTVNLAALPAGGQSFSVTLGNLLNYGGFSMDRAAPTSTVWLSLTGTTTSRLASVGWLDDASGIAQIDVEYQVDGGTWRVWRAFKPGYVNGEAALFGPTDPVAVDTTQHAYCFRSRATDGAGHVEPQHAAADACTSTARRVYLPIIRK